MELRTNDTESTTSSGPISISSSQMPNISHAYNAIKLTNYFSNILKRKHQHKQQQLQQPPPLSETSGENWRSKQLAYQIPNQDIRLLAGGNEDGGATQTSDVMMNLSSQRGQTDDQAEAQTVSDEIKFIRGQKTMASQFKASLYYLNPTIANTSQQCTAKNEPEQQLPPSEKDSTRTANNNKTGASSRAARDQKRMQQHVCFKCKNSIEPGTTCVRVDNLMQVRNQQAKFSSHENNHNLKKAIFQDAAKHEGASGKMNKQNSEEKSSSDEGLGSGSSSSSSSQSSSTAGSHCDDRETPPHMGEPTEHPPSATSQSAGGKAHGACSQAKKATISCDNLNELSIDSLTKSQPSKSSQKARNSSNKSTGGEKCRLFSRKNRTLTWSASLGSLSASLKFGSSSSSAAKSRSETNLKMGVESGINLDKRLSEDGPSQGDDIQTEPIFFHNDCFNCATCNELLVDLRALIYVNDSDECIKQHIKQSRNASTKNEEDTNSEYVNLPTCEIGLEVGTAKSASQISLYCHRHFVELFKPRCQHCDCLILDEECTEAEGKVWHIKHFCCAECKVPLGGHQYIIVDQALNQAKPRHHQQRKLAENQIDNNICSPSSHGNNTNQPFCLQCFDKIFGETCAQCGKLITCDSGAINHELRSWHASADCFKCQHCSKSLLGCPFLPNRDGNIYCSIGCSEMSSTTTNAATPLTTSQHQNKQARNSQVNMSLPHYLDPRTLTHSTVQHAGISGQNQLAPAIKLANELGPTTNGAWDSLMRHKPLIDYLMMSAHSDETSRQLLQYLQTRFNQSLHDQMRSERDSNKRVALKEELKLLGEINYTLNKLQSNKPLEPLNAATKTMTRQQEQLRRDKLNPFLMDAPPLPPPANDQKRQGNLVCMMMDRMLSSQQDASGDIASKLGYMNLDSVRTGETTKSAGGEQDMVKLGQHREKFSNSAGLDCVDRASAAASTEASRTTVSHHQQHQQFVRLVGGVQQSQRQQSKLSQCSPVASLISNEGTISDHSATSSGVSTAPPGRGSTNGSLKSHSPLSSTSSHSSVVSSSSLISSASAATGATAMIAPPSQNNTNQLHQRQSSQLVMGQPMSLATGEQVVRQSPAICSIAATLERRRRVQPITELSVVDLLAVADNQMTNTNMGPQLLGREQSSPNDGFDRLVSQFADNNTNKLQHQRPVGQRGSMAQSNNQQPTNSLSQQQRTSSDKHSFFFELAQRLPRARTGLQVATDGPLDTNGLPATNDGNMVSTTTMQPQPATSTTSSTARMITDHYSTVNKAHKRQQQQMVDDKHEDCRGRTRDFFAITSPLLDCQVDTLTTANAGQMLLQPTTTEAPTNKLDKPLTRPAKSVSFDPNVKDPPSSSTLGRASTLKSALKQSPPNWQQQQQDLFACHELAAMMGQQQQPMSIGSSATMPASFAAQLKAATTGSMAAYNAYYDEFGRRIKLSTLLHQQQLQQQVLDPTTAANLMLVEEQDCQQQLEPNKSSKLSSSPLPGGSLLAKLAGVSSSSRGGRREERKMRQEQQQVVQTQPGLITPLPLGEFPTLQMQQPTTSGLAQVQEEPHDVGQSTSRRAGPPSSRRSRRSSSCQRSYRRYRHDSRRTRSHHRAPSRRVPRCRSRHCRDDSCQYDSDEDDYSSSCSTCSSSSSTCDEDDYTDYETRHRHRYSSSRPSSRSKPSSRSVNYDSDVESTSSYTTSASESSCEDDAYDDEEEDSRRPSTSNSSSTRSISPSPRSTKARRAHHRQRRSSCSSSSHHSSVSRSRTSSSSSRSRRKKAN